MFGHGCSVQPWFPTQQAFTGRLPLIPDICAFAIATSNGSVGSEGQWSLQRSQCAEGIKEAVAIDWLSPSVILKGCREGAVRLWDNRSRAERSEPRIQHPIAIAHVRSMNDTFVVVAGLQHQVSNESSMQVLD